MQSARTSRHRVARSTRAWIETQSKSTLTPIARSPAPRGRGSKPLSLAVSTVRAGRPLHAGVDRNATTARSRPRCRCRPLHAGVDRNAGERFAAVEQWVARSTRAWIETARRRARGPWPLVACSTRAWIETLGGPGRARSAGLPAPRGRGSKPTKADLAGIGSGRPLHAGWLDLQPMMPWRIQRPCHPVVVDRHSSVRGTAGLRRRPDLVGLHLGGPPDAAGGRVRTASRSGCSGHAPRWVDVAPSLRSEDSYRAGRQGM